MSKRFIALTFAIALLVLPAVGLAQEGFEKIVRLTPSAANTLVLFNVEKILNSPIAQKEGWKEEHYKSFEAGLVLLPPETARFVTASQLDVEYWEPIWDVMLYDLTYDPSLATISRNRGGRLDQIGEVSAVALPGDIYVVKFEPRVVGAFMPGNRQMVGRWARAADAATKPQLSRYLMEALGYADVVGSPIIMALDLTDAISPARISDFLAESPTMKEAGVAAEQAATVLRSIRGVTLGISMTDQVYGKIKIDFNADATPLAEVAQALFLEVLGNRGAMINDFKTWKVETKGNQVTLAGTFTKSGMQRIFSVFDVPPSLQQASNQRDGGQDQDPEKLKAEKTLQYFRSVNSLRSDLQRETRNFITGGQFAMWFDKYARRIEGLPLLNVDKDMLDYGGYVANQLRTASAALRGAGIESRTRQVNLPNFYNTYTVGEVYGGTRWRTHGSTYTFQVPDGSRKGQERTRVRTEQRAKGATAVREIMADLEKLTAEARRVMTERYQIEF